MNLPRQHTEKPGQEERGCSGLRGRTSRLKKKGNPLVSRIKNLSATLPDAEAVGERAYLWDKESLASHFKISVQMVGYHLRKNDVKPVGKLPPISGNRKRNGYSFHDAASAIEPNLVRESKGACLWRVTDLAKHFGLSYYTASKRLRNSMVEPSGKFPAAPGDRPAYGYEFDAAAAALAEPVKRSIQPPPDNLDEWAPNATQAMQRMATLCPNAKTCPFTRLPCELSVSCIADELMGDPGSRIAGNRLRAAELCENYNPRITTSLVSLCSRCLNFQTPGCTFSCFRVAHGRFIRESFAPVDHRQDAQKVELV